jgi:hypothetical protein
VQEEVGVSPVTNQKQKTADILIKKFATCCSNSSCTNTGVDLKHNHIYLITPDNKEDKNINATLTIGCARDRTASLTHSQGKMLQLSLITE